MKQNIVDNIYMDELDMQDEVTTRPATSEELEHVQLGYQPEHLVFIRSKLAEDIKPSHPISRLEHGGIRLEIGRHGWVDPAVITHRLNANPSFKSVKQKRRSFAPERQKAINEEVSKLL